MVPHARRRPHSIHSLLGQRPNVGSPVKIVVLDPDDHGDQIPRTAVAVADDLTLR
jgi:hypothetical protein